MGKITKDHIKQGIKAVREQLSSLESAVEQDLASIEERSFKLNDKFIALDAIVGAYTRDN